MRVKVIFPNSHSIPTEIEPSEDYSEDYNVRTYDICLLHELQVLRSLLKRINVKMPLSRLTTIVVRIESGESSNEIEHNEYEEG